MEKHAVRIIVITPGAHLRDNFTVAKSGSPPLRWWGGMVGIARSATAFLPTAQYAEAGEKVVVFGREHRFGRERRVLTLRIIQQNTRGL